MPKISNSALLVLTLVSFNVCVAEIIENESNPITKADRFAYEILDPSMEFVWRSHRIRQKILARLGIPDDMELHTVPERTSDRWLAAETWSYIRGPKLTIYSNENEWLETITFPIHTQVLMPFGLFVGAHRKEFVEKLDLEDSGGNPAERIWFESNLRTTFGPVSINVTIEFDEKGNSTQIMWSAYDD